jgi:hypothetical protein
LKGGIMEETAGRPQNYDYLRTLAEKLEAEHIPPGGVHAILITPIIPPQPHPKDSNHNYVHRASIVYGTSTRSRELKHIDTCVWEV